MAKLAILSVATTGLSEKSCGILDLTIMVVDKGKLIGKKTLSINPGDVELSNYVDELMTKENYEIGELSPRAAVKELIEFLEEYGKLIIVGYNVDFHIKFLRVLFLENFINYGAYFYNEHIDLSSIVLFNLSHQYEDIKKANFNYICSLLKLDYEDSCYSLKKAQVLFDIYFKFYNINLK
jgi:DNA polymerase III alpha subunit (gram-positive type)